MVKRKSVRDVFIRQDIFWQCFARKRQEHSNGSQIMPGFYFLLLAKVAHLHINEDGIFPLRLAAPSRLFFSLQKHRFLTD
ncbi:hypothetical protein BDW75DRAFT_209135 [Aspergillus navahoensis]